MIYAQDVWSWQQHLRSGGTTPWQEWLGRDRPPAVLPVGWSAPGAAQLELVRRLALEVADPPRSDDWFAALADLVTSRSGPGRGLGQQPLWWPRGGGPHGDPPEDSSGEAGTTHRHRVGAPPVDPAEVPLEELVRVGVGVLTELLLDPAAPPAASPSGDGDDRHDVRGARVSRLLARTQPFVLDGAPVTASAVRQELAAAGHVEQAASRVTPRVLLLAEPFDQALAQAWSVRVQRGAPARWAGFVARWSGRRELPPSVDLPALAAAWADRLGAGRVHVVVAPGGAPDAARVAAEVLGLRPSRREARSRPSRRPAPPRPGTAALSPAGVDAARRVNAVLGVRAAPPDSDAALRLLVETLPRGPARMALTVPARFQAWAHGRAERLAAALREGGYPVHGSLEATVPDSGLPTRPDVGDTLEVVLTACLALARRPASEGAVSGG